MATGSNADVQPLIGSKTEIIRLDAKMVLPGFIESHCHAVGVARGMLDQTYAELSSIAEMQMVFAAAQKLGWQMSYHVTGDEGTRQVLEALGRVAAEQPDVRKRRFTLIHAYFPSPDIVRQCRELGVCVDTQGYLYYRDADIRDDFACADGELAKLAVERTIVGGRTVFRK